MEPLIFDKTFEVECENKTYKVPGGFSDTSLTVAERFSALHNLDVTKLKVHEISLEEAIVFEYFIKMMKEENND